VSVNGKLVDDKMCRFKGECVHFSLKKFLIYTRDGANAKFSTNSHETDNSEVAHRILVVFAVHNNTLYCY
jgi:hypothetical protein